VATTVSGEEYREKNVAYFQKLPPLIRPSPSRTFFPRVGDEPKRINMPNYRAILDLLLSAARLFRHRLRRRPCGVGECPESYLFARVRMVLTLVGCRRPVPPTIAEVSSLTTRDA